MQSVIDRGLAEQLLSTAARSLPCSGWSRQAFSVRCHTFRHVHRSRGTGFHNNCMLRRLYVLPHPSRLNPSSSRTELHLRHRHLIGGCGRLESISTALLRHHSASSCLLSLSRVAPLLDHASAHSGFNSRALSKQSRDASCSLRAPRADPLNQFGYQVCVGRLPGFHSCGSASVAGSTGGWGSGFRHVIVLAGAD